MNECKMYSISVIFEAICSIEKLYTKFIPTDTSHASVIAGLLNSVLFNGDF